MPWKLPQQGLDPCPVRSPEELEAAAILLGDTCVLGCELSLELQLTPSMEFAETWGRHGMPLQSMLIAERWLIEFLTGPPTYLDKQTNKRRKREDDICVDCFVYDWRLPVGPLANELLARKEVINKLVTHPTWRLITEPPRQWKLTRVARCVEALDQFAHVLGPEHSAAAEGLESGSRRPDGYSSLPGDVCVRGAQTYGFEAISAPGSRTIGRIATLQVESRRLDAHPVRDPTKRRRLVASLVDGPHALLVDARERLVPGSSSPNGMERSAPGDRRPRSRPRAIVRSAGSRRDLA
jgi:hypothetical protein